MMTPDDSNNSFSDWTTTFWIFKSHLMMFGNSLEAFFGTTWIDLTLPPNKHRAQPALP